MQERPDDARRATLRGMFRLALCCALLACASPAWGYGYTRDEDPLLKAFRAAVRAARAGDLAAARDQAAGVEWQLRELEQPEDLGVSFREALRAAHAPGTPPAVTVAAWANLVCLALLQKFHWNLREGLADYHRARARLDAAQTYYELALAGNVRRRDAAARKANPKAPSRHEDIVKTFAAARRALGSPGLFGAGKRPPDAAAFRAAVRRIVGHLRAVFPDFVFPGTAAPPGRERRR